VPPLDAPRRERDFLEVSRTPLRSLRCRRAARRAARNARRHSGALERLRCHGACRTFVLLLFAHCRSRAEREARAWAAPYMSAFPRKLTTYTTPRDGGLPLRSSRHRCFCAPRTPHSMQNPMQQRTTGDAPRESGTQPPRRPYAAFDSHKAHSSALDARPVVAGWPRAFPRAAELHSTRAGQTRPALR
jgi:hypothetical protein